jgi:hypothetical protein
MWILIRVIAFLLAAGALVFRKLPGGDQQQNFWIWPFNHILEPTPPELRARSVYLPDQARNTSSFYAGGSGVGKTSHVLGLLIADVIRRITGISQRGWIFVDVYGDAADELITRLSLIYREYREKLRGLIVVIDPTRFAWSVGYNPLTLRPGDTPEELAARIADAFMAVFGDDPTVNVRQYRVSYFAFLTIIYARGTLLDVVKLLQNQDWRMQLVTSLNVQKLNDFWFMEFPSKSAEVKAHVESSLNRIGRIIETPGMSAMLAAANTIDLRDLLDRGAFIIVRMPKGRGTDAAYMLSGFLLTECMSSKEVGQAKG